MASTAGAAGDASASAAHTSVFMSDGGLPSYYEATAAAPQKKGGMGAVPPPMPQQASAPPARAAAAGVVGGGGGGSRFGEAGGKRLAGASAEEDFLHGVHVASCHLAVRMAFMRKVYGILCAQLSLTVLLSALFMFTPPVTAFVQSHPSLLMVSQVLSFVLLFALMVNRKRTPTNFYLLAGFTLCMSYLVATVVTLYTVSSVLQAAVITTAVVGGLTLFTFQTKYDFTFANSALVSILWTLIGLSFVMMVLPTSNTVSLVYSFAGAALFSGFIVVDTQMMMNKLSPDEYIVCAINLYLDILNLFLHILKILGQRR